MLQTYLWQQNTGMLWPYPMTSLPKCFWGIKLVLHISRFRVTHHPLAAQIFFIFMQFRENLAKENRLELPSLLGFTSAVREILEPPSPVKDELFMIMIWKFQPKIAIMKVRIVLPLKALWVSVLLPTSFTGLHCNSDVKKGISFHGKNITWLSDRFEWKDETKKKREWTTLYVNLNLLWDLSAVEIR